MHTSPVFRVKAILDSFANPLVDLLDFLPVRNSFGKFNRIRFVSNRAVFDFDQPVTGKQIQVKLEQNYGQSLLLARSKFSISHSRPSWNRAEVKTNWEEVFAAEVFAETKASFAELKKLKTQLTAEEKSIPKTPVMLELDAKKSSAKAVEIRA